MKSANGMVIGMLVAGLALPAMALVENFESDTVGSVPHALLWATQQVTVVASGTDGIATPDGSANYVKAVYDKTGWNSTYWAEEIRSIPDSINIDVTDMMMDTVIRIEDIRLPAGVEAVGDPDTPVVTVLIMRATAEDEADAAEGEAAPSDTEGAGDAGADAAGD